MEPRPIPTSPPQRLKNANTNRDSAASYFRPNFIIVVLLSTFFGFASGMVGQMLIASVSSFNNTSFDFFSNFPFTSLSAGKNTSSAGSLASLDAEIGSGVVSIFSAKNSTAKDDTFELSHYLGSGAVLTSDGYILVHENVISDNIGEDGVFVVVTKDKEVFGVQQIFRDTFAPIAFLKITGANLKSLEFADTSQMSIGSPFVAFQYENGVHESIEVGSVAAVDWFRNAPPVLSSEQIGSYIYITPVFRTSLVGSPVFTFSGKLVGMLDQETDGLSNGRDRIVSAEYITPALSQILESGKIQRPALGVQYQHLSRSVVAPSLQETSGSFGALLMPDADKPAIVPGSAAAQAGLIEGDVILKVGERPVDGTHDLSLLLQSFIVGDVVELTISRNGEVLQKQIQLR